MLSSKVIIRQVELSQAAQLLDFSKITFYEAFAHLNSAGNMEAYSAAAFTFDKTIAELSNLNSSFYFAMLDDEIAGYIKLNYNDAQTEFRDVDALKVERIYVSSKHQGKKIGGLLLNFAMNIALAKHFSYVWLGVWEHNQKAIGFYKHNGFEVFGSHPFLLGDDLQMDLLMKKELK